MVHLSDENCSELLFKTENYLLLESPFQKNPPRLAPDQSPLFFQPRISILLDAALGLSHLHCAEPKVFHRDIKSQNILLDKNGAAKMADFGLALLASAEGRTKVEHTSGTIGYADPLYINSSIVTERSESYSFGMVGFFIT